ncbi:conserved exported hypothetical protein [Microbacterium sp. C448]|uniref:DUF58 domain-containing protein n=1 Tax=Microbacterium TaxID=33882 RepID=UPI0003DE2F80|nr:MULTISPECIES: DUF58 domain-containing protein [Microbacterium]CDK00644.1 conserved exported hypothetical protein [Microbacterium sp. C448]
MFVTGRLAVLVGLGVVPVILLSLAASAGNAGAVAWAAVAGWLLLCTLVAVADASAAADPRDIRVERDTPGRARLGVAVRASITVAATGRRRLRGLLRDGWEPTAGVQPSRHRLDIPAGESRTMPVSFVPRRRGERRTAFVAVRSLGPLGLAGRQAVTPAPASLRVLPPFHASRHLPSRLARLRELDGSTSVQVRGQGTEFDSLREYVRGDDVRSIDWRATARARTTMLRTWRPERDRHVVIVIDTGRTSAARVGDGTRLDAAMESALLLAALADRAGDHVHLLMFDRVVRARVSGVRGTRLLPALVDAMAGVEPQLIDTDWDAALAQASRFTSHASLVVLLTALDTASASRSLLAQLPAVTARGRVLVGAVTDVMIEQTAAKRERSDDLWLAAAAERTLLDTRRLSDALMRLGAEAILRGPDDLPPQIADRYLALKAAGRL